MRRIWIQRGGALLLTLVLTGGLAYILYCETLIRDERAPRPDARPEPAPSPGAKAPRARPGAPPPPRPAEPAPKTIRIGWTAWTDAELISQMVERLLEAHTDYEVQLTMADIGIQYQGVADGSLDAMLMAWLPMTHHDYWERLGAQVVNLGPMYLGARLGWAVPDYVPKSAVRTVGDLSDARARRRFGGKIQGIDPGSGLMQVSERALEVYGLADWEIVASSGAAMTAALERAIRKNEWVVITAWSPHWIFAQWDLRYLEDPRGILGGRERVHALVRRGFYQDFDPRVTAFLARLYIPLAELQQALLWATQTSVAQAADRYIENHPARVHYWLTGELQ